jgi:hypothetical protein
VQHIPQQEKAGTTMTATQKVHREPVSKAASEKVDYQEQVANLFTSGVARIADAQKKAIDVAAQQSAEAVDLWKKAIQNIPGAPGLFMLELAANGFERFAETQKAVIDMTVEHSHATADLVKDRTIAQEKSAEKIVSYARQGVERTVATHKKVLDLAAAQTKEVFENTRDQFGPAGSTMEAAADSIQRGVTAIVDAQKQLLEMVIH